MLRVAEQYAVTDTGRQRRANEDSLLARSPLFVVADGMGGAQAGEVASSIAIESFQAGVEDPGHAERALAELARAANRRIHDRSLGDASQAGMGTTLTAVYVGEREVAIAHVGDSRAYCLREGELVRLTDDHSLVDELMREGRLTPEEAEEHPQRSVITRALGIELTVEVDTRSFRGRDGDVYLVCSDGLTTMLAEEEIARLLRENPSLRDAGEALVEAANAAGGRDNITVILLRLEEVGAGARGAAGSDFDAHETLTGIPAVPPPPPGVERLAASPTARRVPRLPAAEQQRGGSRRARHRRRGLIAAGAAAGLLALIVAAAWLALQSVYFVGTDDRGLVTMYQGVPYVLPGGLALYRAAYVSGVGASTISAGRRRTLLDHSLRSEANAAALIRSVERQQVE